MDQGLVLGKLAYSVFVVCSRPARGAALLLLLAFGAGLVAEPDYSSSSLSEPAMSAPDGEDGDGPPAPPPPTPPDDEDDPYPVPRDSDS